MHILIVGGTRFVGHLLAFRLAAAGYRISLLNRGSASHPLGDRIEQIQCDRTTPAFAEMMRGRSFDAVVDFAAYRAADARQVVEVFGPERVGHYIFISTGQVYLVRAGCPRPSKESDYDGPLIPDPASDPVDHDDWLYGIHKREAEDVLAEAWATARFPCTRLRIPMVNGERDHFRRIESYLWRILDGGPVLLPDGGRAPCRHVYGMEVAGAIQSILRNGKTFGQVYNLCQDEAPPLVELVNALAELLGAPARVVPVTTERLRAAGLRAMDVSPFSDPWMSHLDPTRARRELGFRHQPLTAYLEKIVASFLSHPPATRPDNYRNRAAELRLAAELPEG